jgi:hypothetical protein
MIREDLIELWQQLLDPFPCKVWHAVNVTDAFEPKLQSAVSLSEFQYETILISTGILSKYGDEYRYKKPQLEDLKRALKAPEALEDQIDLNITRRNIHGKYMYFIAVEAPQFNPPRQLKRETRIRPNRCGNGLDET